jgi:hypothetical protein
VPPDHSQGAFADEPVSSKKSKIASSRFAVGRREIMLMTRSDNKTSQIQEEHMKTYEDKYLEGCKNSIHGFWKGNLVFPCRIDQALCINLFLDGEISGMFMS